jgi:hypothetical protein
MSGYQLGGAKRADVLFRQPGRGIGLKLDWTAEVCRSARLWISEVHELLPSLDEPCARTPPQRDGHIRSIQDQPFAPELGRVGGQGPAAPVRPDVVEPCSFGPSPMLTAPDKAA